MAFGDGRSSDYAPPFKHLLARDNRQWHCLRHNGAHSCGTVGDFHSLPFLIALVANQNRCKDTKDFGNAKGKMKKKSEKFCCL